MVDVFDSWTRLQTNQFFGVHVQIAQAATMGFVSLFPTLNFGVVPSHCWFSGTGLLAILPLDISISYRLYTLTYL